MGYLGFHAEPIQTGSFLPSLSECSGVSSSVSSRQLAEPVLSGGILDLLVITYEASHKRRVCLNSGQPLFDRWCGPFLSKGALLSVWWILMAAFCWHWAESALHYISAPHAGQVLYPPWQWMSWHCQNFAEVRFTSGSYFIQVLSSLHWETLPLDPQLQIHILVYRKTYGNLWGDPCGGITVGLFLQGKGAVSTHTG